MKNSRRSFLQKIAALGIGAAFISPDVEAKPKPKKEAVRIVVYVGDIIITNDLKRHFYVKSVERDKIIGTFLDDPKGHTVEYPYKEYLRIGNAIMDS